MKTREGFVSNSSSSSFIVPIRDIHSWLKEGRSLTLSPDKVMELIRFGFRPTKYLPPSMLENSTMCMKVIEECTIHQADALAFQVLSNQNAVLEKLIRERVPFQASCHYGHETVIGEIKEDGDRITIIQNPGVACEMYGTSYLDNLDYYTMISTRSYESYLNQLILDGSSVVEDDDDDDSFGVDEQVQEQPSLAVSSDPISS